MILRAYIECPACQAPIILRVGVARQRQPFTVACPTCDSPIRGETVEADDGFPRFHLPGIKKLDPNEMHSEWQVITTYGDLPNNPASGGFSAFLSAEGVFGDYFPAYLRFLNTARWFGERVDPLEHAYTFYLKEKWDLLDSVMSRNFDEFWPESPTTLDRHTFLHRFVFLLVACLDSRGVHPRAKYEVWSRTRRKEAEFSECAHSVISKPEFTAINRRIADQFFNLLRNNAEWFPTLAIVHLRARGKQIPQGWQVPVGRIDSLRDAYRQNFEVSCQMLPLVIRMQNIAEGRDPESIRDLADTGGWTPRGLSSRDLVNNINQYTRAKAATKEAYLSRSRSFVTTGTPHSVET
ncbi:hypothetical protein [Streptomyces sp. NPDC057257]|uniref:hypothetical protein n=1 Tax=Streptomyces sp. NPDC057257 TaxID=3346071 RepID=UPI00362E2DA7